MMFKFMKVRACLMSLSNLIPMLLPPEYAITLLQTLGKILREVRNPKLNIAARK